MRQDSRLSRVLHVLIHMAHSEEPMSSEMIAKMLNMNSVVVRRTLAGLRKAKYVSSSKGHGGGWSLSKPLGQITLLDVYEALGKPNLFAMGLSDDSRKCLIEKAVNETLGSSLQEAEAALLLKFKKVKLSDLAAQFEKKMSKMKKSHKH